MNSSQLLRILSLATVLVFGACDCNSPQPTSTPKDAGPKDGGGGDGGGDGGCTPVCNGKVCGSANGCGGLCQAGSGCCTQQCSGKACGTSDGCGGTCQSGSGCVPGDGGCAPFCTGKICGSSDGCTGTCQNGSGCCTPFCSGVVCGSADGCGGTCQPGSGCTVVSDGGCTPVCTGKVCGTSDGCTGTCQPGSGCTTAGDGGCTPVCTGKVCGTSDGCTGTCQPGSGCTTAGDGGPTACAPPTYTGGWGSGSGDIGNSCTATSCAAGEHCYNAGASPSMCYLDCSFDSSVCPGSSICVGVGGGEAWCLKSCDWSGASNTCPTGMACNPFSSNKLDPGVCFPACTSAAACNGSSGLYNFKCGTTGATKGACLCTRDSDCNSGGTGSWKCDTATGGCIMPCTSDGTCATSGAGGCCLTQSGITTQCELFTNPSADCTTLGCATGWQCQNTGTKNECVATQPLSCSVTTQTVNKTAKETVAYTGSVYLNQKAEISFTVPSGASAWTIIAQGPGTHMGLVKVVDPNGTTLWDWTNQPPYAQNPTAQVWAIVMNDSTETYTFPNTAPSSGVPAVTPGTWKVTIGSSQITKADVTVLTKSSMPPTGNKVDVDFWVVSNSYTAASLQSASGWSNVVSALSTYWGHGGVTTGTITYHDVSASIKAEFASIDADSRSACDAQTSNGGGLHKLFHSVTPGTNTGINFFMVDNIASSTTSGILGIDGAIPGPGGANATPVSGAIAMIDLTNPSMMGYILAHEGGHFFGLWHTTEGSTSPVGWDPIADTPACASGNVANCGCTGDRSYLMYPYAGCTTTGTISPNEGVVMRAAPSIY